MTKKFLEKRLISLLFMRVLSLTEEWQEEIWLALAQGLDEATEFPYLESRISQVELLEIS